MAAFLLLLMPFRLQQKCRHNSGKSADKNVDILKGEKRAPAQGAYGAIGI